ELNAKLKQLIDFEKQKLFFQRYKSCARCVDKILAKTLKFAVAFHHAG
uniref:Uncharacterized protein n=1 Tax=Romanomermis culicivorax TaxID=13658 RepID=A0A915K5X6_ROMCU